MGVSEENLSYWKSKIVYRKFIASFKSGARQITFIIQEINIKVSKSNSPGRKKIEFLHIK